MKLQCTDNRYSVNLLLGTIQRIFTLRFLESLPIEKCNGVAAPEQIPPSLILKTDVGDIILQKPVTKYDKEVSLCMAGWGKY